MDIDLGDIGGSVTCLRVYGALDGDDSAADGVVRRAGTGEARARDAAIDLSHVSSVSAAGLRWLLALNDNLRSRGRLLVLFAVPPAVRDALHEAEIDRVIPVAADEVSAVERLFT